mgnify:CR=1 FL=1
MKPLTLCYDAIGISANESCYVNERSLGKVVNHFME